MLYIKDQSLFRKFYKTEIANNRDEDIDTSFINTFHPDSNKNYIKGFSFLTYGTQRKVGGFLQAAALNVAADQQAIYELIQNADDCESELFSIFYNREYLLCINNGLPFSKSNMSAIINIGDSDKDAEDIGTFGIGFKIIHRLLGEDDGLKAIMNDYAGPIVFSWNQYNHLEKLLNEEEIKVNKFEEKDESCPWLLKIVYTCFPTHIEERVKNEKYLPTTLFRKEELSEFKTFLKSSISNLSTFNENNLKRGSIFFLRIGSDKFKYIDDNIDNIVNGIGYSFNFLKKLKRIYINDKEINKEKIRLKSFEYKIGSESFKKIRPRNEERSITFSFAHYHNYKEALKLKEIPNIFNFFSMEEEKNGWCFLLHCNSFDMHNDRRKLQPNSNINERLLPYIANEIKEFLQDLSSSNTELFINIYPSLLLTDIPENKPHIKTYFYNHLISILSEKIPTNKGFSDNKEDVVIKKTKLSISPVDWGIEKEWFYWTDFKEDEAIIKEAQNEEKLGLERMSISSLIENGDIETINEWISNAGEKDFTLFINELEKDIPDKNFFDLQFLKCTDEYYYSINEIASSAKVLCVFEKIHEIKDIINDLELITTEINISDFRNIAEEASKKIPYLKTINEKKVFDDFIKNATPENSLNPKSKKRLFIAIKELYNVGDKSLKEWELFSNTEKDICSLNKIISPSIKVEKWLFKYQLLKSEFFEELEEYLLQVDDIYPSIIFPLWDELIVFDEFDELNISDFYSSVKNYFDEEAHKSLVLNKKAYIYTNEGFYPTSEVFYNESFSSIMDYPALKSSIEKVTGFKTPSKKVLKYLTETPFKTDNDKLIDHLSDCTFEQSEAYELLRFCQKAEVKLFSKGFFNESGNDIDWECNDSRIQYFSEDSKLIEFINEYLEDTFYLLPSALQDFKSFEGIRRNQELYDEIIEQLENINELAVEFLPLLLKHKEVIKSYLSNLPEIRLEKKNSFDKDSFEYLVISNIVAQFEDTEFEEIREKFLIYDDEIEFKLQEIVTGNEVQFEIDDKIYSIKVSEILPDSDNFTKAEILESIIANFKKLELPKTKIDKLFSIEIEEDDLAEKLADELIDSLNDNIIETTEQVAFCLLYELHTGWNKFDDFQIYASNNEKYKLNEVWYVKSYPFLNETGALAEQYKGLSKFLKLKEDNPIFKVNDNCIFLLKPAFDEEGNFLCKYIDEELEENKCIALMDFLFEEYNKRGKESRRDFESIEDWSKLGDTETEKIFGFNPYNTIISEDDEFLMADEVALDWLQNWANDQSKISFLKVLSIHFDDSDIINLRKSLYNEDVVITIEEINESSTLSAFLLENTLKWMVEAEIWAGKVINEPEKVELLDTIIEKLEWDLEDYWSVDIEKLKDNSEEWDDEGYNNWRAEYDSFEIKIFHNPMPYILKYDEQIISEKFEKDYWFDEDNETLFVNGNKSSIELIIQNAADEDLFEIDIKPLISKGLAKVNELERKVKELEEENRDLKSTPDKSPKKTNQVSEEDKIRANLEARIAVKSYLLKKAQEGYDVTEWNPNIGFASVCGKIKKNGEYIDIVVKSAKWGDIFLAANEFELLCQDSKNQLFVYNGYEVKPVTLNSIFEANSLIQLQIDTNHINGKFLGMLAKAFQYVTNTKFVVEDPNHSAHTLLNKLGMSNLNEGFISTSFDDEY